MADKLLFDNREDVRHMWSKKRSSSFVDDLDAKYKDKNIYPTKLLEKVSTVPQELFVKMVMSSGRMCSIC